MSELPRREKIIYTLEEGGGGTTITGSTRTIRFPFSISGATSSSSIPASSIIFSARVNITSAFDNSATTIRVGNSTTNNLVIDDSDSKPSIIGIYEVPQETSWGGTALPIIVTIVNASTVGSGICTVFYGIPDS